MRTGTGTGTERADLRGRNGTRNREMERPSQAGQAAEEVDENAYVGRGCAGVLGGLSGGDSRYVLEHTVFVTEERKTRIGIERDVPGQYGTGHLS